MAANPTFSDGDTKIGCVKWFNNKAGYGFVTLSESSDSHDIFVHHSSINVAKNQYKYLVQGEYVSFVLEKVDNEKYSHQAKSVSGINGGPLMCETRQNTRTVTNTARKQRYTKNSNTSTTSSNDEFVKVARKRQSKSPKTKEES